MNTEKRMSDQTFRSQNLNDFFGFNYDSSLTAEECSRKMLKAVRGRKKNTKLSITISEVTKIPSMITQMTKNSTIIGKITKNWQDFQSSITNH